MTASCLDRLGELAGKATPGPWFSVGDGRLETVAPDDVEPDHAPAGTCVLLSPNMSLGARQATRDADFIAAASPSVVAALVRVAKAALEKRDAAHAINHTVAGAWEAGCKRYDAATEALSAALSAVEGVGSDHEQLMAEGRAIENENRPRQGE